MKERRTFSVVDSPIQLRLLAIVIGVIAVILVLSGSYVWYLMSVVDGLASGEILATDALYERLYYRGLVTLFSVIFTFFIGLFLIIRASHRIVGPLFRMKEELGEMRRNRDIELMTIRDRDRIHGFVLELNQLLNNVSFSSESGGPSATDEPRTGS